MKSLRHNARACAGGVKGIELFRTEDEWGEITVTQTGDKRVLGFGSELEQSSLLMSRPHSLVHEYTQIMLLGLLFVKPRHITVLGLGGGGLGHCLQYYYPEVQLQFVELRQTVIDVAYEWFDLPRVPQLQVCCADAFDYLASEDAATTGLIFSDLYEARGMSEVQLQLDFVENAYRLLDERGWLVINFHQLPSADSRLMQRIGELYKELYVCDVFRGNWILFCGKQASAHNGSSMSGLARELSKRLELPLMYYFRQLRSLSLDSYD